MDSGSKALLEPVGEIPDRRITQDGAERENGPSPAGIDRSGVPDSAIRAASEVLETPGQPLDGSTRAFFESQFGHDFRNVRVHEDSKAAGSARQLGAASYTAGTDVFEGSVLEAPETGEDL